MAITHGIYVDGTLYQGLIVTSLKREGEVLDGPNAGRSINNAAMIRDVLGTFYNYTITVDQRSSDAAEYDAFFEAISAPVDSHEVTFPYAQTTLTFEAYVTSVSDEIKDASGDIIRWGSLSAKFVAMEPQRT